MSAVSDRDDFVAWMQSRLRGAQTALHDGDPGPRLAIWSTREPVSVLGAWRSTVGQEELRDLFHSLADTFSNCTSHVSEIVDDPEYKCPVGNVHFNGRSAAYEAFEATGKKPLAWCLQHALKRVG